MTALVLAFLACQVPLAEAGAAVSVTASGPTLLDGDLRAWTIPGALGLPVELEAKHATVRSADRGYVNMTGGRLLLPPERDTQELDDVHATLVPWQEGRLAAWPMEAGAASLQARVHSLHISREARTCVTVDHNYTTATPRCVAVRGGGSVRAKGPDSLPAVTVTGDFSVFLLGWNITGEARSSSLQDWSGLRETRNGGHVARGTVRQLELIVQDGTLRVPLAALDTPGLVLSTAVFRTEGAVGIAGDAPARLVGHVEAAAWFDAKGMTIDAVTLSVPPAPAFDAAWQVGLAATLGAGLAAAGAACAARWLRPRDPVLRALRTGQPLQAAFLQARQAPEARRARPRRPGTGPAPTDGSEGYQ